MRYAIVLLVLSSVAASAQAASEYATLIFGGNKIVYIDKHGSRTDGGKPDLFAELSGEEPRRADSQERFILVLNGLSKKGWEIQAATGEVGGQPSTYLLRRDAGNAAPAAAATVSPPVAPAKAAVDAEKVPLTFSGGHDTDPRDGGRPVVLIAAALGVPAEVFRDAFSGVRPARGGEPEPGQVRQNKETLMNALGKHGITSERLDEVSNFYRYRRPEQQVWRSRPAAGYATVKDGKVAGIIITDPGAGYSSSPTVTVPGINQRFTATVVYGADLERNGSIKEVSAK